ncbi:FtsX-like permease family protein [Candidatus Saccharibacteria bacterium]|nr:FtsX-like permease family protein [Candidatus Saccharibacteria bacterium]
MRIIDILRDANSNLWRSKIRSVLTILAIFIGSFTIILNTAINAGVNEFMDQQIENMGGEGYLEMMPTETYESAMSMISMGTSEPREYKDEDDTTSHYIKDDQIKAAEKIDGIKEFKVIYPAGVDYITSNKTDKRYKVDNIAFAVNGINFDMLYGAVPDASEDADYEIALTESMAKALGFEKAEDAVGQTIKIAVPNAVKCHALPRSECITMVEAKVSGIQAPGILSIAGDRVNYALWDHIVDINYDGAPEISKPRPSQAFANGDPEKITEIKDKLKEIGLSAMSIDDEAGMFKTFFDAILIILNIFGGIALAAAAIGIINTLFMSVQERTSEIGLDKALGMSSAKVFFSFSAEAIMLGFWGSLFGIIMSVIAGSVINVLAHATFLKDFPTFNLVVFDPKSMLTIVGIIMLIAFLAGTLPARKAAKKNPIDSLRYE